MRVILEHVSGPQSGRRIHMLRNQRVQVGNTSWADFVVRDDAAMASQHFALETDFRTCRLRDLVGNGGTQLNGQPIAEVVVLRSGDQISAGQSTFIVHIEGGDAPPAPEEAPAAASAPHSHGAITPKKPVAAAAPKAERLVFKEECDSQAIRYFGSTQSCPPGELAKQLAALWPLHIIADFRRAKVAPPAGHEAAPALFDWLGPHGRQFSPLVLGPNLVPDPTALVEGGWGQDGLIGVFSTQSADEVVGHWRNSVRSGKDRVVGVCWPGILGQICSHYREDFVRNLLAMSSAVLVEGGEGGNEWNLFSLNSLDDPLQAFGFKLQVPEAAAAA